MNMDTRFTILTLFQMKICLNKECPELDLGLGWDTSNYMKKFGVCRSGIKGVSDQTMQTAYKQKLNRYTHMKRSVFNSNLHRAIRTALDSTKLVQSDALSLCGYAFDFEVLLDKNGEPIPIPMQWKYKSLQVLCASVGMMDSQPRPTAMRMDVSDNLLKSMRDVEKNCDDIGNRDVLASMPICNGFGANVNLSSDWGVKFQSPSRKPARKLVIEGDGPHHTASNYPSHLMGSTIVKRRQIETLGWELLNVSSPDT